MIWPTSHTPSACLSACCTHVKCTYEKCSVASDALTNFQPQALSMKEWEAYEASKQPSNALTDNKATEVGKEGSWQGLLFRAGEAASCPNLSYY